MAATVTIRRWTGAGPTKTDITGINTVANASDAHQATTLGSSNPIRVPAASSNNSFWVTTRLSVDVTPAGTINNLKWYSDGANSLGTGVTCVGQNATSYIQATGTTGTSGDVLNTSNHSGISGAPVSVFTFTSGSPKSLTGTISNPSTGDLGDFFVYQVQVDSTAGPGVTGSETFTYTYDET